MREYIYLHDECADVTPPQNAVKRFSAYNAKCQVCGKNIEQDKGHAWLIPDKEESAK